MRDTPQHPTDLKPRGQKTPLGLIAWSVISPDYIPDMVEQAARDTGRWPDGLRYVPGIAAEEACLPSNLLGELLDRGLATIEGMARCMEHGATKYAPWNWQAFPWDRAAETEYFGAIMRHITAAESGEERAEDSGCRHYDHAAAGCMIWAWHLEKIAQAGQ